MLDSPNGRAPAAAGQPFGRVALLQADPDLGEALDPGRLAAAAREIRARTMSVPAGEWVQPQWPAPVHDGAGLLLLSGLVVRRVGLERRYGAELLGAGDLLRPWQRDDAVASMQRQSGLRVLRRSRVAILDLEFLRRAGGYPEVTAALVARALRRSRHLAVNMAIVHQPRVETRLHMLLWHLADRWGTVRPDAVVVPVPLTHAILADLVAAQRPTVSLAMSGLERRGLAERAPGGWLLYGAPPHELAAVAEPAATEAGADGLRLRAHADAEPARTGETWTSV
jgi:CRP-like cAMP-binding protein